MKALSVMVATFSIYLLLLSPAQAQVLPVRLDPFGASQVAPEGTWVAQRARSVILQRYDRGCGPAVLATVLSYLFGDDVSEEQLLDEMLRAKAEEGKVKGGFSFLDLIGAAERRGYKTLAGRAPLEELEKLTTPAIVLLDRRDLRHFVVLWGVIEDRVHLGDPLIGNTTVALSEFAQEWLGMLLIVQPPNEQMEHAVAKTRDHLSYMEQMSLRRSDSFALDPAHRSLLGTGISLFAPVPGEF